MKRVVGASGVAALLGAFLSLMLGSSPVAAATCDLKPALGSGVVTTVAGGKGVVQDGAVRMSTPALDDAVTWKVTLGQPVALSTVTNLSYTAMKVDDGKTNAAAMPAFRVYLDNGKTLFFEPYYQTGGAHLDAAGNPKLDLWTVFDVDSGKFWQTGEGGGSYAGNRTLAQFKALYPAAKVTAIGVGQGTYNAGTVGRFKAVQFVAGEACVSPTASSGSGSVSGSAVPSASGSSAPAVIGTGEELARTGARTAVMGGTAIALVALGVAAFVAGRRRRVKFTAGGE